MTATNLAAEIEALRREIAAMRAERREGAAADRAAAANPQGPSESDTGNFADQMRTLAREVLALADETEKGAANHPLASVLGALVLGILISRLLHR